MSENNNDKELARRILSGTSVIDDYRYFATHSLPVKSDYEKAKKQVEDLYQGSIPRQQIEQNLEDYAPERIFQSTRSLYSKLYQFDCGDVNLSLNHQKAASYMLTDAFGDRHPIIHVDTYLFSMLYSIPAIMFAWSAAAADHDEETVRKCFTLAVCTLNEVGNWEEIPGEGMTTLFQDIMRNYIDVNQFAENCLYTMYVFIYAHEIAHLQFEHAQLATKQQASGHRDIRQELAADRQAYRLVLYAITNHSFDKQYVTPDAYLAPLMLMDILSLQKATDRALHQIEKSPINPQELTERRQCLFGIIDDPQYQFDTVTGNRIYNCFLDICDDYQERLESKKRDGSLSTVIADGR